MTNGLNYSAHLLPLRRLVIAGIHADAFAQGAFSRPPTAGGGFADQGGWARSLLLLLTKPSALKQANAHGLEITRADRIRFGQVPAAGPDLRRVQRDHGPRVLPAERQGVRDARRFPTG